MAEKKRRKKNEQRQSHIASPTGIANKKIKSLCDEGLHLSLLFVKQKDQSEHKVAVLKMAPEIRKAVNATGGYVYLGLLRCRAYDRFCVTQC